VRHALSRIPGVNLIYVAGEEVNSFISLNAALQIRIRIDLPFLEVDPDPDPGTIEFTKRRSLD